MLQCVGMESACVVCHGKGPCNTKEDSQYPGLELAAATISVNIGDLLKNE